MYSRYKDKKKEYINRFNTLDEDSKLIIATFEKFEKLMITSIEYNRIFKEPCSLMNIFRLTYLDLIRRNILYINENNLYINTKTFYNLKAYERQFIEILFRYINFDRYDEGRYVSLVMKYPKSTFDIFECYQRNDTIELKYLYCLASSTPITYKKPSPQSITPLQLSYTKQDDFYAPLAYILDFFHQNTLITL